jgi:ATP-dependent Clp protease ATP-binding subunit ClpB
LGTDSAERWGRVACSAKLGANIQVLATELSAAVAKLPQVQGQSDIHLSPGLNRILEDAQKEADQFKDEYVSTEHLLIALAKR